MVPKEWAQLHRIVWDNVPLVGLPNTRDNILRTDNLLIDCLQLSKSEYKKVQKVKMVGVGVQQAGSVSGMSYLYFFSYFHFQKSFYKPPAFSLFYPEGEESRVKEVKKCML